MPLLRTLALTLRRRRTREADALLTLFTRERGKIIASTKSVRKSSSRLAGVTQPFTLLDVILYAKSRDQDIWTLTQVSFIRSFNTLQTDLGKMALASCLGEWCEALSGEFEANEPVWSLMLDAFERYEHGPTRVEDLLYDQWKLLRVSGLEPSIASCLRCKATQSPRWIYCANLGGLLCDSCANKEREERSIQAGTVQALRVIAAASERINLRLTEAQCQEAETLLRLHLEFHVGVQPRSSLFLATMRRLRSESGKRENMESK